MPVKTWDSNADWADWTLTHLVVSNGQLEIEAGYNEGTALLTSPYEAASWHHWSKLILNGSRPQGTNIYVRFRSGADAAACEAAPWSDYINGLDAGGQMIFDLRVNILNSGYNAGAFVQFEITLVGE
ncbi:MAG: hypothetical protein U9R79_02875 [Armatimonadota bacterium]|nr:hypothetical protein [Armatimonadota bacterium]